MKDKQIQELANRCFEATQVLTVPPDLTEDDVKILQSFAIYRVLRKELGRKVKND